MLTKEQYLQRAVSSPAYNKYEWLIHLFAVTFTPPKHNTLDYHLAQIDGKHMYYSDGEYHPITDAKDNEPLFGPDESVKMHKGDMENLDRDVDTTVMRVVINLYCLSSVVGDLIPYMNEEITVRGIERLLNTYLVDTPESGERVPGKCTTDQLLMSQRNIETIAELAPIMVYASSMKSLVPPPGIKKYKASILKQFKEEGKDINDNMVAHELQTLLKAYDKDFLKDDPAFKRGIDGKTSKARAKLHLSFGKEIGFGGSDFSPTMIGGLKDGLPQTKDEYAVGSNTTRSGSYTRGAETANGGTLAVLLARLVYDLKIDTEDCGTKEGYEIQVRSSDTRYTDQYTMDRKLITKDFLQSNIGKVIKIMVPMHCKSKTFCKYCMGNRMGKADKTVQMFATAISDKILSSSLAAFHGVELKTIETDLEFVTS